MNRVGFFKEVVIPFETLARELLITYLINQFSSLKCEWQSIKQITLKSDEHKKRFIFVYNFIKITVNCKKEDQDAL